MLPVLKNTVGKWLLLAFLFSSSVTIAQTRKERKSLQAQQKLDQSTIVNLQDYYVAITKATTVPALLEYVTKQFEAAGIKPAGTSGYNAPFFLDDGKQISPATSLLVNGDILQLFTDYYPLAFSAEKATTGIPSMALREKGVPWFTDIRDLTDTRQPDVPFDINHKIIKEAEKVASKGATALFLYNSSGVVDGVSFDKRNSLSSTTIPVVYITKEGYRKYFTDHSQALDIDLKVQFAQKSFRGNNLVGLIDNAADTNILVSATYNSQDNTNTRQGTSAAAKSIAMLIETAKKLRAAKHHANFFVTLFDGTQEGKEGETYWLQNTGNKNFLLLVNADKPSMVNTRSDVSTSLPLITFSSSGTTSSEDTGWTQKPAVIKQLVTVISNVQNYIFNPPAAGESKIQDAPASVEPRATIMADSVATVLKKVATDKLATQPLVRTTVSLGIIPDNAADANGLKIKGVSPKKIAAQAGLQQGDVIMSLGEHKILDMHGYLRALSHFQPGDKTYVVVKRGEETKQFDIVF